MAERNLEAVAEVLTRVVRAFDLERELISHAAGPVWERTVGERLSRHTRAAQLRGGVLTVEARSASWMNEVSLLREQIREQLNKEMRGAPVRDVRFRLGGGFPPLVADARPPPVTVTAEEIEEVATELSDDASEATLAVARALALKRKKQGRTK